jgi:L-2-hydroxyglutarate oxidase
VKVLVIGGGLVGLATALHLQDRCDVTVLEKEDGVARHQSGHNSGVLHCGLHYQPGSARARLAVSGIRRMVAFCQEHGLPHEVCGQLVVATTPQEVERLKALHQRGIQNGLDGLEMLGPAGIRDFEPHAAGLAALRVPQEGIADYPKIAGKMAALLRGRVVTGARVLRLRPRWIAETTAGEFRADFIVNCAGLHCDRVARLAGEHPATRIVAFRGEYYKLRPERQYLVRNLIYPVADPAFPFLGVHFTRLIRGGIEAGPNAVLAFAREGYRRTDINLRDLAEALGFSGLRRFLARYPRVCWDELRRSFSKRLFCRSLQKLVPEITISDLDTGGAGVRAQAMSPQGELVQDFDILTAGRAIHVLNAPSPAATASLAIGEEIAARVAAAAA